MMNKRLIAILMAVLMVLQVLPADTLAEGLTGFSSVSSNTIQGTQYATVSFTVAESDAADVDPAQIPSSVRVAVGGQIGTLPAGPERETYRFEYWVDQNGQKVTENTTVDSDMVLSAHYYDLYPGFKASSYGDSLVSISVDVPRGALPENTAVRRTFLSGEDYRERVESALGQDAGSISAVDISFYNYDLGQEVEPREGSKVTVNVNAFGMTEADSLSVIHIKDSGSAEVVAQSSSSSFSFDAEEFSVYIVAETQATKRLIVEFFQGVGPAKRIYVKPDDRGEHFNEIVYDPGVGELPDGVAFYGWMNRSGTYTMDTETWSIDEIREQLDNLLQTTFSDGRVVSYYPKLMKNIAINYLDEKQTVLRTDNIYIRASDNSTTGYTYTVNMDYTPADNDSFFEGWNVTSGAENIVGYQSGKVYKNGDSIKITGNVNFSVNASEGHWIRFHENNPRGTFNNPQFVKAGETPVKPDPIFMYRGEGYNFGGWYTSQAIADDLQDTSDEYDFSKPLSESVDVYARWVPVTGAAYTVIMWKQKVPETKGDEKEYEYSASYSYRTGYPLYGTVDQIPDGVTVTGSGNNAEVRINGKLYSYNGFHFASTDQSEQTIKPDGSTVVNVYFDRNEYTATFQVPAGSVATDDNGTQYGLVSGTLVQLTKRNQEWYYSNGSEWEVYTGIRYKSNEWRTVKTITALYQEPISDQFPIQGISDRWMPQDNILYPNESITMLDVMPNTDAVFHKAGNTGSVTYTLYYYISALPGETVDEPGFKLDNVVTFQGPPGLVSNKLVDFPERFGYSPSKSEPEYVNGVANFDSNNSIRLYYADWNIGSIEYYTGSSFDINGNRKESTQLPRLLRAVREIKYGEDVTEYNKGGSKYYSIDYQPWEDYSFAGWYADPECSVPYQFTTMPAEGIKVYEKLVDREYRVFLHPEVPAEDTTLQWDSGSQSMSFRIRAGDEVWLPTGTRAGWEFVGWYWDASHSRAVNSRYITVDRFKVSEYSKTEPTQLDDHGNPISSVNQDQDRPGVVAKIDFYGLWRKVTEGADGVKIVYHCDENEGDQNTLPSDTMYYVDGASANAGAAPKPANTEKVFSHWSVQKWNGSGFVDTGRTVLPGKTFTVNKDEAHQVSLSSDPSEEEQRYSYTVQLRAVFIDKEHAVTTHIYWYKNDGSGETYRKNEELLINEAVPVYGRGVGESIPSREGYVFKGWAREEETGTSTSSKTLFISYDREKGGYSATRVAADEAITTHGMYAVWDPFTYTVAFEKNSENATGTMSDQSFTYDVEQAFAFNAFSTLDGYHFESWNTEPDGSGTSYSDGQSVKNLTSENNGRVVLYAQWAPDTDTAYKVEHYKQNLAGNGYDRVDADTENLTGTTETTVTASPKNYTGFTHDENAEGTVMSGTIAGDGSLVLKLYYTRNSYKVTYEYTGTVPAGASVLPAEATYKYGAEVMVAPKATAPGYTFNGWSSAGKFEMPANDVEITGSFSANVDTAYRVEHYKQNLAGNGYELAETENLKGTTEETATAKPKPYEGFTYDENVVGTVKSGTITGDGLLVLRLYYTRNKYSVRYEAKNHGSVSPEQQEDFVQSSAMITGAAAVAESGYVFIGWYCGDSLISKKEVLTAEIVQAFLNKDSNGLFKDTVFTAEFAVKNSHVIVTKTTTSTPEHDGAYWAGEKIAYSIKVTNDGNVPVNDITVTDMLNGFVFDEGASTTVKSLEPGTDFTVTGTYTVTDADAMEGYIRNTATVLTGADPDGDKPEVELGTHEALVRQNAHVTVTQTITSTPANGTAYALGETIRYSITVTNDGNVLLTPVNLYDSLEGSGFVYDQNAITGISSLKPKESFEASGSYVVTETDILRGNVVNNATVTGKDPDGKELTVEPGSKVAPVEPKNSHLTVNKEIISTAPVNGYSLGDTITYRITVLNDGNVELHDVSIVDQMEGFAFDASAVTSGITLAPGQSASVTGSYVVTQADVTAGRVLNRATAEGTDPEGKPAEPVSGETEAPVNNRAYTLTIQYVYTNGTLAAESYTQQVQYNSAYSVISPVIPGYTASQAVVSGTMPARNQTVTVIYVADAATSYNGGPSSNILGPGEVIPAAPGGDLQPVTPDNYQNNNQNSNVNNPAQNNRTPLTVVNEYGAPLNLSNVALGAGEFIE